MKLSEPVIRYTEFSSGPAVEVEVPDEQTGIDYARVAIYLAVEDLPFVISELRKIVIEHLGGEVQ